MEYFSAALSSLALVSVASLLAPLRESVRRAALSALSLILLLLLIPKGELDLHALSPLPEAEPPPVSERYRGVLDLMLAGVAITGAMFLILVGIFSRLGAV